MQKQIIEYGTLYNQHSRWGVYSQNGISPNLTASMGLGGGFVPMVIEDKNARKKKRIV